MDYGGMNAQQACLDVDDVAENWSRRGFSCDVWADPPGRAWEDFAEETDLLVMVVRGDVEVEVRGKKQLMKVGEELVIPANALHTVRNVGTSKSLWLIGHDGERAYTD